MNDRAARIAIMLGLAPWVSALFLIVYTFLGKTSIPLLRNVQLASTASTLLRCTAVIWLWRQYVRWNRGRSYVTAILTMLVFAHLLIWQPIWNVSGCADQAVLLWSQSSSAVGLWCAAIVLTWWGGLTVFRSRQSNTFSFPGGNPSMSLNTVRLCFGLALIPFLPGLFWIVGMISKDITGGSDELTMCIGYVCCSVVMVTIWLLLWRPVVEWTPHRRRWTSVLAFLALLAPLSTMLPRLQHPLDIIRITLPLIIAGLWFSGTAIVWRSPTPQAVNDGSADITVLCPQCEYSLRGLREVRCPECGWNSTIDDVVHRALTACSDV